MWVQCHHCGYYFEKDKFEDKIGVIFFHGEVAGYICPHCTISVSDKKEEKKEE